MIQQSFQGDIIGHLTSSGVIRTAHGRIGQDNAIAPRFARTTDFSN